MKPSDSWFPSSSNTIKLCVRTNHDSFYWKSKSENRRVIGIL